MNLMEESFQNKEKKRKSKAPTIILISIIVLFIAIIVIAGYLMYIQNSQLRVFLNGQQNDKVKQLLLFEDDTVYVPIKEISSYLNYESFNGEYTDKSEEQNKCYVQSQNEVANFTLQSEEINKLDLTTNNNYESVYIKKPVIARNGILYVSSEGMEKAFNLKFEYNKDKNRIYIYTMPYLIESYTNQVLDYGYSGLDENFVNQKAVLQNLLVVNKENNKYGVIDSEGNVLIEPKYDSITYIPSTETDFLVKANGKVGIISKSKETKVKLIYDNIELIDESTGLYVVEIDNKYGVIDKKGNIKIHIENDEIGIDISRFEQNNIKNKYLLVDNLIPVKKDNLWALYNKSGKQVTEFKYDSFGYIASNNKNAINLLMIPDYNVLVASKDKKYTLLNSSGEELMGIVADDIYMSINKGEKRYTIFANDKTYDAIAYLDAKGVSSNASQKSSNSVDNTSKENNNTTNGNKTKQNTTNNSNSKNNNT